MIFDISNNADFEAIKECLYLLDLPYFTHCDLYSIYIAESWVLDYLYDYDDMVESDITEMYYNLTCPGDYRRLSENQLKNLFWYLAVED